MSYELHLGDCLEVMRGMADASVDLVVIDPPYNISVEGGSLKGIFKGKKSAGQNAGLREFGEWDYGFDPFASCAEFNRIVSADGQVYVFCLSTLLGEWMGELRRYFVGAQVIDWIKPDPMPSIRQRQWCSANEFIVWAWRGKYTFNYLGHSQMYSWQMHQSPKTVDRCHPNQKPLPLIKKLITVSSNPGDTVLDCFAGSGTTIVACIQTARNGIGIESDPTYHAIAQRRLEDAAAQPFLFEVSA